jgi:type I restriction enzyme S subunit
VLKVICPVNIAEQQTIASILTTCDEAIEKTDAKIEKLKRIKQGLMQDLFRYGIDEKGRMRSEKTHRFKDSPLGQIPVEWEVKTLVDVCEKIQDGTHYSPSSDDNGKFKYITSKNILFGKLDLSGITYISEADHKKIYSRCSVIYKDILLTALSKKMTFNLVL